MKHWSEFLPTRSHYTNKLGKMANTLNFEIQSRELELESIKQSFEKIELQISDQIASNYPNEQEYTNAIESAKTKAIAWNKSPITTHKHENQKRYTKNEKLTQNG